MPIALDPRATFDYVLQEDRELPEEQQTVFELRSLTVSEEARVADSMIASVPGQDEMSIKSGSYQLQILRCGLRGWRNFKTTAGTDAQFDVTKGNPRHVTDECLDRLSSANRTELTNAITEHSSVSEEEGNS
jgi:hypothetical protein